jgi:hypothetical protein
MYVRRFQSDPGDTVLLEIESINILDLTPPASFTGVGSGTVIVVGEFENGPYKTPQQVLGVTDLMRTWGTLGYQYAGAAAAYPSAPVRQADGGLPEYWNGNAFVQMSGLKFSSLIAVRVDTSVGKVEFEAQAYVEGAVEFSYQLTSGQELQLTLATESTTLTASAVLPVGTLYVDSTTGFASSGTIVVDGNTVAYTGVTAGSNPSFTGCSGGSGAVSAGDVVMGGTISTAAETFTGTPAIVDGGSGSYPVSLAGGTLMLAYDSGANFTVTFQSGDNTVAQVASRINAYAGFTFATVASSKLVLTGLLAGKLGNVSVVSGSAGVLAAIGLTGGTTAGGGNVNNINNVAFSEVKTLVEAGITGTRVELNSAGALRVSNTASPGTGALLVASGTTAAGLGFTVGEISTATDNASGTIPAGTIVTNAAATALLVTTQDCPVLAGSPGPYTVPVRFAIDDGSGTIQSANTLTVIQSAPSLGSFAVDNPQATTAALTESQIDAAYAAAIQATTSVNSVTKIANLIVSARQSNTVRSQLRQNALYASDNGSYGRVACVSPPLNTPPSVAMGASAPGVVATRDERVVYCYVGRNTFVPLIGQVGITGGAGFNATGNVDVHSDMLMASICSQLPPEENPGQATTFTTSVNGIETGANVQGFDISDYTAFKAAGIAALRMDEGVAVFQSGVTSVDPTVYPQLVRIARRRMADYIEDSIASPAKQYGKRLSMQARRKALKGEIRGFMARLLNKNSPGRQRIAGYTVTDTDGNSDTTLSAGMYRITTKAKTLPSLDSIVIACTVGDDVDVTEILPANA